MYVSGTGHTIDLTMLDAGGDNIVDGTVTCEISKDSAAYAATSGSAVYVDEELWKLTLTDTEATCSKYRVRVTHDDLPAPVIYTDEAWPTTIDVNVLSVNSDDVELITDYVTAANITTETTIVESE